MFFRHPQVIIWSRYAIGILLLTATLFVLLSAIVEKEYEEIPVFVIAGQSNAVGYGATWQELPADLKQPSAKAMFWYLQGSPQRPRASKGWVNLAGAEHKALSVLGSELSIGRTASAELGSRVAIIKVAFNGTALALVDSMDWNVQSSNELFAQLLHQIHEALSQLPNNTKGILAGFFWIQGESDAKSNNAQPDMSLLYRQNLEALIKKVRKEFNKTDLPVVIARIAVPEVDARGRYFGHRDIIRGAQQAVAEADRRIALISTDDLEKQNDQLHYTSQGQLEMGQRLFEAWLQLIQDK